ncbi:MAG: Mut7-C RNAse domain-containing protein [Desulfobaccales bacterium]
MKFLVDAPLRGLAKWLRLCGFDAEIENFSPAKGGLPPVPAGVYILSRQGRLQHLGQEEVLVLAANDPEGQLAEVFRRLNLKPQHLAPLSRCGECNGLLEPLSRDQARGLVPEHVYYTQTEFYHCPGCGRVYWPGSHPPRITAKLQRLFGKKGGAWPGCGSAKGASHGL